MEKTKLEKENDKNAIALFKFAIIAPLVNNNYDYKSKEEFYRVAALKKYTLPNGKETILTAGTIKRWFIEYKNNGFDALKPRTRTDAGLSRKIPIECINKVEEITMILRKQAGRSNADYTSRAFTLCPKALSILVNKLK